LFKIGDKVVWNNPLEHLYADACFRPGGYQYFLIIGFTEKRSFRLDVVRTDGVTERRVLRRSYESQFTHLVTVKCCY